MGMIKARSGEKNYQVLFSNGIHSGIADTTADKGGANSGLRPHDLLEAALATCMVMWIKMYGDSHHLDTNGIEAEVVLDRSRTDEVVFEYSLSFVGKQTQDEKRKLASVARTCPVHRTLSKTITLKAKECLF